MLKSVLEQESEEERYSRKHIYTYGDGPILDFDGEIYDGDKPRFFIPEKYRLTVFVRIHIRNTRFIPADFDQLVRYAGEIYVDNSEVMSDGKIPSKIIINNSLILQKKEVIIPSHR